MEPRDGPPLSHQIRTSNLTGWTAAASAARRRLRDQGPGHFPPAGLYPTGYLRQAAPFSYGVDVPAT
jgi:hypothetical protein